MTTRFIDHLLTGNHAGRPSASSVPDGTLYSCTTHNLVYQSASGTWGTWLTAGGSGALDDLSDVTITSPSTGEALVYNGSAWVNDTVSGSSGPTAHGGDVLKSGFTRYTFDDSALTGLTSIGSPTTLDADTTLGGHLYVKCTTTDIQQGVHHAWTAGNGKRVIVKLAGLTDGSNYYNAGIGLLNVSSGKTRIWGIRRNNGFDMEWRDFNGYVAAGNNNSSQVAAVAVSSEKVWGPIWIQITYNTSTSYDMSVSRDGLAYTTVFSGVAPTYAFTPDAWFVGFAGQGAVGEAWFEYVDYE